MVKIQKVEPVVKYPITPDGNKSCYLILHLGVPEYGWAGAKRNITVERKIATFLGIRVHVVYLTSENNHSTNGNPRYLLRLPYFRRDDLLISRIADALLVAASVTFGPFLDVSDQISTYRIPWELVRDCQRVLLGEITQFEELKPWSERVTEFPVSLLSSSTTFGHDHIESAWKLLPLLLTQDNMLWGAGIIGGK